jgi:hypothetical protein
MEFVVILLSIKHFKAAIYITASMTELASLAREPPS